MSNIRFQEVGPLMANSKIYVPRYADEKAAIHLRRMEYISLIEPRQQGKTSLINRLIGQFSQLGYTFATRDLMAAKLSAALSTEWYNSLGKWLSRQIHFIPLTQQPKLPTDSASWENFLAEIAERAEEANQKVVIVLDEIGGMPHAWATEFFSVIRSVYTSRQSLSFWQYITFIIAGAFNPKDLIQDKTISNFNVDHRVPLSDFNFAQVKQLVTHLELPDNLTEITAEQVHYWTDGQPYLSQRLCVYLEEQKALISTSNVERLVAESVEQFLNDDTTHLERIKSVCADPTLLSYVKHITNEQITRLSAGLNDKHFHLANINGIIKAGPDALCRIRNRIYERAITEIEESFIPHLSEAVPIQTRDHVFISYSHKDKKWLDELLIMLSPRVQKEMINIWVDTKIEPGTEWQNEVHKALVSTRVAVLLVTPNFLASEFIAKYELHPLLKAAEKEGLMILWIAVSTSWYNETSIASFQAVNDPTRPLDTLNRSERNKVLVHICDRIKLATQAH